MKYINLRPHTYEKQKDKHIETLQVSLAELN